jgi:hypothetical protein
MAGAQQFLAADCPATQSRDPMKEDSLTTDFTDGHGLENNGFGLCCVRQCHPWFLNLIESLTLD